MNPASTIWILKIRYFDWISVLSLLLYTQFIFIARIESNVFKLWENVQFPGGVNFCGYMLYFSWPWIIGINCWNRLYILCFKSLALIIFLLLFLKSNCSFQYNFCTKPRNSYNVSELNEQNEADYMDDTYS